MDPKDPIDQFHLRTLLTDVGDRSQAVKELRRLRHDASEWARMREHAGSVRSDTEDPGPQQVDVVVDMSDQFEALAESADTSLALAFQGNEILASLDSSLDSIDSSLDSIAQDVAELPEIRRNTGRMASDLGWLKVQGLLHLAVATRSAFDLAKLRFAFEDFAEDFRGWSFDVLDELRDTRTAIASGFAGTQELLVRLAARREALDSHHAQLVVQQLQRVGLAIAGELAASSRRVEARLEALVEVAKKPLRTQADELVRAARVELACGNSGGAMTLLRRAIVLYPSHPEAWLLAGSIRWTHDLHQTDAGDAFARSAALALHLREEQAYESAVLALAAWSASVGLDGLEVLDHAMSEWNEGYQELPSDHLDRLVERQRRRKSLSRIVLERHGISLDRWLASGAAPRDWPGCEECIKDISRRELWREALTDRRLRTLIVGTQRFEYDDHDEIIDVDEGWGAVPYLWAGTQRFLLERLLDLQNNLTRQGGFDGEQTVAELWMMLMRIWNSLSYLADKEGETWFLELSARLKDVFLDVGHAVNNARWRLRDGKGWQNELHAALCKTDALLPQYVVTGAPMVIPDWPKWKWRAWFGPQGPGPVWRHMYGRWLVQFDPSWG